MERIELENCSVGLETACSRKPAYDPFWLNRFRRTELLPMSRELVRYLKRLPRKDKKRAELDLIKTVLDNAPPKIVYIHSTFS